MHVRHSLAMYFATFGGSDIEALDPIVELQRDDVRRTTTAAVEIGGGWWMEGGMDIIDVGETATVL
ncbi:hypothetical protein EDB92DRAFT_1957890 [Lactarius akahatsu]|uniref:Uncharacterized protein n=1 Tax=Lactarius akahatsu TaxID=416441 RepID=A0AAD4L4H7_9AGAM|nr:hypothetical protein EDB92DRAFT_1959034 [Lactarius akahatsu]KAH8977568.1 hypothetical protein EDB92DRAFT_1957890 [Lactarius akahatsu]